MNHKNPTPDAHDILSNGETITAMTMSGLFQALPFAVILHGPDGVIFDCNEAACRLFGYSRREMRLLRHGDLLPENLLRIGPGSAATDMTTNGAFLWVSRRDKFGMLFQCEYSSRRVTIDGSDYSLSCYRRTESGGMAPPDLPGTAISGDPPRVSSPICVFTWQEMDGELRLMGYNPAMEELTRGKIRQYAGCTAHELYFERGRSDVIEVMYRVYRERGILKLETFCDFLMPGNERFVDTVTFFVEPNILIQFMEDITDRRHALAALQESEERFKALHLGSPVPVITWRNTGGDFVLTGFNPALEKFTRGMVNELIGSPAGTVFHSNPVIAGDVRQCYEKKGIVRREAWCRLASDTEARYLMLTHAYVPSDFVITHVLDITEKKRYEAELLRYQQELSGLYEKQITALEHERKRISQELHDGIGQYLSTIKISMENLLAGSAGEMDRSSMEVQLQTNFTLLKEAIVDISKISMDLRPSILDDLGIIATINWFLREFGRVYTGIRVDKRITVGDGEIPQNTRIVIFRVLQEAMNNIARHSHADRVTVGMARRNGTLEFTVRDNGVGFDLESVRDGKCGLGIAGMRERAAFSGGRFSVKSAGGKGTTVRVAWKLND